MSFNPFFFLVCLFPLTAMSAGPPCGLRDVEEAGKGWLSAKNPGVLKYVVARKQFESKSMPKSWTVSSQAREAAIKGFLEYFRKISPPSADKSVFSIKGMQAHEMKCAEGFFIFYDVNLANLAWESPAVATLQAKEIADMHIDKTSINELLVGVPTPKQPLASPVGVPKVFIED